MSAVRMDLPWWQIWMDRSMPMVLEKNEVTPSCSNGCSMEWALSYSCSSMRGFVLVFAHLCQGGKVCGQNMERREPQGDDPPVHARNLFHVSVAMWDAWCAFDEKSVGYVHRERGVIPEGSSLKAARHQALSYAAYRTLTHRYSTVKHPETSIENARAAQRGFVARMREFGYPIEWMQEDEEIFLRQLWVTALLAA